MSNLRQVFLRLVKVSRHRCPVSLRVDPLIFKFLERGRIKPRKTAFFYFLTYKVGLKNETQLFDIFDDKTYKGINDIVTVNANIQVSAFMYAKEYIIPYEGPGMKLLR